MTALKKLTHHSVSGKSLYTPDAAVKTKVTRVNVTFCVLLFAPRWITFVSQVRLDTMVTVVDAGEFLAAYTTGDKMMQRPDLGVGGKRPRQ